MYINHLTLATGNCTRVQRGNVQGETLARVGPWLEAAIADGGVVPLPVAALSTYLGQLLVAEGSLIATIYGPGSKATQGIPLPLVSMGVAKRSRHAARLWPMMIAMPGTKTHLERPGEPWAAAAIHPTIMAYPDAVHWLGDLERCIAWAWVTRPHEA